MDARTLHSAGTTGRWAEDAPAFLSIPPEGVLPLDIAEIISSLHDSFGPPIRQISWALLGEQPGGDFLLLVSWYPWTIQESVYSLRGTDLSTDVDLLINLANERGFCVTRFWAKDFERSRVVFIHGSREW